MRKKLLARITALILATIMFSGCTLPKISIVWPDKESNTSDVEGSTEENTNDGSEEVPTRAEFDKEFKDTRDLALVREVRDLIKNLRHSNTYISIQDGPESSEIFLYNKKGECVAQSSTNDYLTIFRNDNISYSFTDVLHVGEDISMLQLVEHASERALNGGAVVKLPTKELENGLKEVRIYLDNWEQVKGIYSMISDTFALKMMTNMQSEAQSDDFALIFDVIYSDDGRLSVECNVCVNNKVYTSWYFDGYLTLSDWELQEDWYTLSLKTDEETGEATDEEKIAVVNKAEDLLTELLEKVGSVMKAYADENGIEIPEYGTLDENNLDTESTEQDGEEGDNSVSKADEDEGDSEDKVEGESENSENEASNDGSSN